ncbi:hypothetical protein [Pseudorhodobacter sp. E13]|uniref:hypothetical protein n=1 Tax=Pseudorhodobacter sp. E13 TaxID=2487931 RepID=UPI0018F4D5BD|nr:hypothetical protein [Pseudorhodobacter sp. E13]
MQRKFFVRSIEFALFLFEQAFGGEPFAPFRRQPFHNIHSYANHCLLFQSPRGTFCPRPLATLADLGEPLVNVNEKPSRILASEGSGVPSCKGIATVRILAKAGAASGAPVQAEAGGFFAWRFSRQLVSGLFLQRFWAFQRRVWRRT